MKSWQLIIGLVILFFGLIGFWGIRFYNSKALAKQAAAHRQLMQIFTLETLYSRAHNRAGMLHDIGFKLSAPEGYKEVKLELAPDGMGYKASIESASKLCLGAATIDHSSIDQTGVVTVVDGKNGLTGCWLVQ